MSDIEKWIAQLPRPEPSLDLDRRVVDALRGRPRQSRESHWRRVWPFAFATCAGLIGFVIGRQTSTVANAESGLANQVSVTQAVAMDDHASEKRQSAEIVDATENEALAFFVMPPRENVSLFGSGQLHVSTKSTQME